jgi:hypothetical protein
MRILPAHLRSYLVIMVLIFFSQTAQPQELSSSDSLTTSDERCTAKVSFFLKAVKCILQKLPQTYLHAEWGVTDAPEQLSLKRLCTTISTQIPSWINYLETRIWSTLEQTRYKQILLFLITNQSFISLIAHLVLVTGLYQVDPTAAWNSAWNLTMMCRNTTLALFDVLRICNKKNLSAPSQEAIETQNVFYKMTFFIGLCQFIFNETTQAATGVFAYMLNIVEGMRQIHFDFAIGNTPQKAFRMLWDKVKINVFRRQPVAENT